MRLRELELREVPISALKLSGFNWRLHDDKQKEALAKAISEVGFVQPLLVSRETMTVLDGHLRLEVAKAAGMDRVPCLLCSVTLEEEKAILATMDLLGELAVLDFDRAASLLQEVMLECEAGPDLLELVEKVYGKPMLEAVTGEGFTGNGHEVVELEDQGKTVFFSAEQAERLRAALGGEPSAEAVFEAVKKAVETEPDRVRLIMRERGARIKQKRREARNVANRM